MFIHLSGGIKKLDMVMAQYMIEHHGMKNPRQILGLSDDMRDPDYIKFKYNQLVKQHHPDAGGSAEKFKEITEAYHSVMKELE